MAQRRTSPTHTYDNNGNLTSDGSTTYAYDVENRLTSATGGTSATLSYDPMGRLHRTAGSTTTQFLYDGDALVAEYDGSGRLLKRYIHGAGVDEPLIWYEGSGLTARRQLRADHQGSIVSVTDSAGLFYLGRAASPPSSGYLSPMAIISRWISGRAL